MSNNQRSINVSTPGIIGLPTFVAGILMTTVGTANHWFAGVHTVGLVLIVISCIPIVFVLLIIFIVLVAAMFTSRKSISSRRRW